MRPNIVVLDAVLECWSLWRQGLAGGQWPADYIVKELRLVVSEEGSRPPTRSSVLHRLLLDAFEELAQKDAEIAQKDAEIAELLTAHITPLKVQNAMLQRALYEPTLH